MEAAEELIEVQVHDDSAPTIHDPLALEVVKLTEAREKLRDLPPRPDPLEVEDARKSVLLIQNTLKDQLEELYAQSCPPGEDLEDWRSSQVWFWEPSIRDC